MSPTSGLIGLSLRCLAHRLPSCFCNAGLLRIEDPRLFEAQGLHIFGDVASVIRASLKRQAHISCNEEQVGQRALGREIYIGIRAG